MLENAEACERCQLFFSEFPYSVTNHRGLNYSFSLDPVKVNRINGAIQIITRPVIKYGMALPEMVA